MTVLLFAGADYYPHGGWDDHCATFDDVETAELWLHSQGHEFPNDAHYWDWAQIVDERVLVRRFNWSNPTRGAGYWVEVDLEEDA